MPTSNAVLKRPLILTEKGNTLKDRENKYLFEVSLRATKNQIKSAIQEQFPEVHVVSIHTMVVRGKDRRMGRGYAKTQNWKKAVVALRDGEKIDYFDAF